jgi:hypothetical protein
MDIIQEVRKLDFPVGKYVVVGSGPLAVRGLKEARDIDIVVTEDLFERCISDGWDILPWTYPEKIGQSYLRRGIVELNLDVNSGDMNLTIAELIGRAELIDDVSFITVSDMIRFKRAYLRNNPKHEQDILVAERYLKER